MAERERRLTGMSSLPASEEIANLRKRPIMVGAMAKLNKDAKKWSALPRVCKCPLSALSRKCQAAGRLARSSLEAHQ